MPAGSYPPGSLVLQDETMDSLYTSIPNSSKKKYNGKAYMCRLCSVRIKGTSPNQHYRERHQPSARIRFADQKSNMVVKRSPTTDLFDCPRCSASFKGARALQIHVADWNGKCAPVAASTSPSKPPVASTSRTRIAPATPSTSRTNARQTPARPTGDRRAVPTPITQKPKTVARPLKTPTRTRTGIPQISRTFRAMIRQCYNQRVMSNKEIAEYCNCDVRDVHFAVNNETHDNLDEDQDYLHGRLGDIINIDDADADLEGWEMPDASGMDTKMEMDVDDGEEEPVEDASTVVSIEASAADGFHEPRGGAEAYMTPESDAPHGEMQDEMDSEDEVENYIQVDDSPEPSPTYQSVNHPGVKATRRKPSTRTHKNKSSPKSSPLHPLPQATPPADPIRVFVASLRGVTQSSVDSMTSVFKLYGVSSSEDLDQFSEMEPFWDDAGQYFRGNGMSPSHWDLIQDGLRARAAALRR